ncbi:MAG: hypothetical protein ATN36_08025 [Epulopiscium sp. Nele67-Bin005]|nr:MAG: hypothetical protein ATN36_08025 [Epulopiscium sp. Nele67-Bin005]
MKLTKKLLSMVATLAILVPNVYAQQEMQIVNVVEAVAVTEISNDTLAFDYNKLPLSERYPTLSDYIVPVNQSVEFDGIKVTVEELLVVEKSVYLSAIVEKSNGLAFDDLEYFHFDNFSIDMVLSPEEEEKARVRNIVETLVNNSWESLFDIITEEELDLLIHNLDFTSYSRGGSYGQTKLDNGTFRYNAEFDFEKNLDGEQIQVTFRDLLNYSYDEKEVSLDFQALAKQCEGVSDNIWDNLEDNFEELNQYSLNYKVDENFDYTIELVRYYVNDDGETVINILSSSENPNSWANLNVKNVNSAYAGTASHVYPNFVTQEIRLDNIDELETEISIRTMNIIAKGNGEIQLAIQSTGVPTLTYDKGVVVEGENGFTLGIDTIKVTPMGIILEGGNGNPEMIFNNLLTIEVLDKDGSSKMMQSISSSAGYDTEQQLNEFIVNFRPKEYYKYVDVLNIENISAIKINGMTITF